MLTQDDQLKLVLKNAGYSDTKPRLAIFSALKDRHPQTMNQLVQSVSRTVNRASVYRTIDLFIKLNIVERVSIGWKYRIELSDQFSHHHHHMSCSECNTVISFDEPPAFLEELKQLEIKNGFTMTSHNLEISGLCSSCSERV